MTGKRLVVCCDGTWNSPHHDDLRSRTPTNVLRMVRAIAPQGGDGVNQIVYYDAGVGTGGAIDRWVGGATGKGISTNIRQAYQFLGNNYAEGDEIWLFGFSRGAYTVRSLGGFIGQFGIMSKSDMRHFTPAYAWYHTAPEARSTSRHAALVDQLKQRSKRPKIRMLGVWDTVAIQTPDQLLERCLEFLDGHHRVAVVIQRLESVDRSLTLRVQP